jgi:hypothetical protein
MTKMHELLAVQTNLNGQATKTRTGLMDTFRTKRHLFEKKVKAFQPLGEGADLTIEEQSDIQTTVPKEIEWLKGHLVKQIDVGLRVDVGNRIAEADVVDEEDTKILAKMPATTLLWLEKRVQEVKELIEAIHTLDPAKGFTEDRDAGVGYWKAREVKKERTKKKKVVIVKYDAVDKHPAQTELVDEDVVVGTIREQEWSALITPAMKAELLNRAEMLIRAVAKARSKANEQEVDIKDAKIGDVLLDYVFKPLLG